MTITGELFLGSKRVARDDLFQAYDPATGALFGEGFSKGTREDAEEACARAADAFPIYAALPLEKRAGFLDAIADEIEALGDELIERGSRETGLPTARLTGERGRTCGQLRLFAKEVRDGAWQQLRIDHADAARAPVPKPDLRLRTIPVGPVVVFGASNFPLAFSTAGGDTASALAAGCPVIVKAHQAHPGTAELVASAIIKAAEKTGMPDGVFSMVSGSGQVIGTALVADPHIQAVGFTGSRSGGTALMKVAQERPQPIPVYAEMSSINPVVLMPEALKNRGEALAKGYVGSLSMGAGQFCTNPGLVLGIDGPELDAFLDTAGDALLGTPAQVMLSDGIHKAFEEGRAKLASSPAVKLVGEGQEPEGPTRGRAAIFAVSGKDFIADPAHAHEVFGMSSMVVKCADANELVEVLSKLEGQLTATLQIDEGDYEDARKLIPVLERTVGRILCNGWPTGVEVGHAMVHGGPFPATSDGRTTSVGTLAIHRFLRPVSYQDFPEALLPEALREGNQQGALTRIDGAWTVG
ncbi:aldehyde dehydrogenase (NADP(+)) [Sphingomonas sp. Leaf10]|uniref:aldehyde dehydrogenase (NADP(+)) n=1 Tax=Sphingomonas sp. Leaf10 TaxID=1735676 RepID=UPI0006FB049F|nr:aldehyde dehydrogenase (NADP(+)) [Sphingomonas sp. Leaf10]KQM30621.1 2,5-dioxovalerate dehydrogenase [Sphingomonas sp. Leaf10]